MTSLSRCLRLLLAALALLSPCCAAPVPHKASEVLLVFNAASPISTAVARDYAAERHVTHIVAVHCPDSALRTDNESISYAAFTQEIAVPVEHFLAAHRGINFIVLTKGVPIRIRGGQTGDDAPNPLTASLDSCLAAIDYPSSPFAKKASLAGSGTVGIGWINRYYHMDVPFSHARFGGYLVTRLDGYTQADAMGLVRQALAAEHTPVRGSVLFDIEPDFGSGDKAKQPLPQAAPTVTAEAAWSTWNADMFRASDLLAVNDIPHETAVTRTFVGGRADLLGYFSWGSNDDHFTPEAYESLRFAPGSLGDTAVSTGGRTFLPTRGGQTLIADLIAHGLTCCQGYVDEPILDGTSSPTIDLSHYLAGYTMAESFYAGTCYLGWEGICIGDPLCCPYAGRKLIVPLMAADFCASTGDVRIEPCRESGRDLAFISDGASTAYDGIDLTGAARFTARVASAGPGGRIEIRLDSLRGTLLGTCPVHPTGDWQMWATEEAELSRRVKGVHKVCLVYTGGAGNLFNLEWFALHGSVNGTEGVRTAPGGSPDTRH